MTTTTTTQLDLDAIVARDMNATPGPWDLIGDDEIGLGVEENGVGYSYDVVLVQVAPESDRLDDLVHNPNQFRIKLGTVKADAEFIEHAREDVSALVAEVKRLRAERAEIEQQVRERVTQELEQAAKKYVDLAGAIPDDFTAPYFLQGLEEAIRITRGGTR